MESRWLAENSHLIESLEAGETGVLKCEMKIGDVVSLKSGGPRMTVDEVRGDQAHCTWFIDGKREGGWFAGAIMKLEP
jgi:uncharacterized protein YodC (DUF2158 family)